MVSAAGLRVGARVNVPGRGMHVVALKSNGAKYLKKVAPARRVPTPAPAAHARPKGWVPRSRRRPVVSPTRASPSASPRTIKFYDRNAPYYELTNFWTGNPFRADGRTWKTSEHYFQAGKFLAHPAIVAEIVAEDSPRKVFDLARRHSRHKSPDWDRTKDARMMRALTLKFKVPHLRNVLKNTGNAYLVEDSPHDPYWGVGPGGNGRNMLGKMLMKVRARL